MRKIDISLPDSQIYNHSKKVYWFYNEKGKIVWKYWEDSEEDQIRRLENNYFYTEKEAIDVLKVDG